MKFVISLSSDLLESHSESHVIYYFNNVSILREKLFTTAAQILKENIWDLPQDEESSFPVALVVLFAAHASQASFPNPDL